MIIIRKNLLNRVSRKESKLQAQSNKMISVKKDTTVLTEAAQTPDNKLSSLSSIKSTSSSRMKQWLTVSLLAGVAVLSGCTDRVMLANNKMAEIRNLDALPVDDPPQPQMVEDYEYAASDVRSPFMAPSLLNFEQKIEGVQGIAPDETRKKEPLESYELTQLIYRGVVISPEGEQFGLVQRPDGVVDSVKVGDYMGMNDGRIVEITPTQINLIEIVPDSRAGYVEKPASVVLPF